MCKLLGISTESIAEKIGDKSLIEGKAIREYDLSGLIGCDQVKAVYELSEDSNLRSALWKEWNRLSLQEVREANTYEEVLHATNRSPSGSEAQKIGYDKLVGLCTTLEQYRDAYNASGCGLKAKKIAFENWHTLALNEIKKAYTIKAIEIAIKRTPPESEAEKRGYEKLIDFCNTLLDIRILYEENDAALMKLKKSLETTRSTSQKYKELSEKKDSTTHRQRLLYKGWSERALIAAENAQSIRAYTYIYHHSPNDSLASEIALEEWISLSLREVKKADTIEKLQRAYKRTPKFKGSEAEALAIQKIAALLPPDR
jgi:hypothetical protein